MMNASEGGAGKFHTMQRKAVRIPPGAVVFPWQKGDILMLDNFLASHERRPFVGPRRVLVGMAELFTHTTHD